MVPPVRQRIDDIHKQVFRRQSAKVRVRRFVIIAAATYAAALVLGNTTIDELALRGRIVAVRHLEDGSLEVARCRWGRLVLEVQPWPK